MLWPASRGAGNACYPALLGALAAALLSKAMALSLPLALLALDAKRTLGDHPRQNRRAAVLEHGTFWLLALLYVIAYALLVPAGL